MTRGILFSAAALIMLAAPAVAAQQQCMAPVAPTVPNGRNATAEQMTQANRDVVAFIRASDEFQNCLIAVITAEQESAKQAKKSFDNSIKTRLEAQGDRNQEQKVRIGTAYNQAAQAYRTAHPTQSK